MLLMFTIIGAIMFAGVSVGGKAPPEKAKTEIVVDPNTATVTDTETPVMTPEPESTIAPEPESSASTWLEKIYLFLGSVIGITILRYILRFLPSAANYDFIGWVVKIINLIYGAWIENRKVGGGTFKRNYSK